MLTGRPRAEFADGILQALADPGTARPSARAPRSWRRRNTATRPTSNGRARPWRASRAPRGRRWPGASRDVRSRAAHAPRPGSLQLCRLRGPGHGGALRRARFGGPIGALLAEAQERVLVRFAGRSRAARSLDVGTGTGRAALALAARGAHVTGIDASLEMLRVARERAAAEGVAALVHARRRARACRSPTGRSTWWCACGCSCTRPTGRRCVGELCRVARERVVLDYPRLSSAAALQAVGAPCGGPRRRSARSLSRAVRCGPSGASWLATGFASPPCTGSSCCPSRSTSESGRARSPSGRSELSRRRAAAAVRLARHASGRTVRVLVTGATGFTGGHLARGSGGPRTRGLLPSSAIPRRAGGLAASGIRLVPADLDRCARPGPRRSGDVDVVYNIAAVYRQAGLPTAAYRR